MPSRSLIRSVNSSFGSLSRASFRSLTAASVCAGLALEVTHRFTEQLEPLGHPCPILGLLLGLAAGLGQQLAPLLDLLPPLLLETLSVAEGRLERLRGVGIGANDAVKCQSSVGQL